MNKNGTIRVHYVSGSGYDKILWVTIQGTTPIGMYDEEAGAFLPEGQWPIIAGDILYAHLTSFKYQFNADTERTWSEFGKSVNQYGTLADGKEGYIDFDIPAIIFDEGSSGEGSSSASITVAVG